MKQQNGQHYYKVIEDYLEDLVTAGKISSGVCLPSERELAKKFKVSNKPVRRAISNMVERGLLEQVPGKGAFIKGGTSADTGTLAVLHSHGDHGFFASSFYSAILAGVQMQAQEEEKRLIFRSLKNGGGLTVRQVLADTMDMSDGILLIDPHVSDLDELLPQLQVAGKPVILVNTEAGGLDTVVTDNRGGVNAMTEALWSDGHRDIVCLYFESRFNPVMVPNYRERAAGFTESMMRLGAAPDRITVRPLTYLSDIPISQLQVSDIPGHLLRDFEKIMDTQERPSALLCLSDELAILVLKLCRRLGIVVPDDMSVTGFDGIQECNAVIPALATVETRMFDMGVAAVERLLQKKNELAKGIRRSRKTVLPAVPVMRESYRALPGSDQKCS